jgi:hypothetical protein
MLEVRKGGVYNAFEVKQIISEDKWPMLDCKACGGSHIAAIRKIRESQQGGEFEFVEAECPNRTSNTQE